MGKFDNIFIVSDIDNTFLAKDRSIPQRNLEALKYFKKEGGGFTFATGRSHMSLLHAFPDAADLLNAPGIISNGAYLYDFSEDKLISPMFLDKKFALDVGKFILDRFPDTGIRILTTGLAFYSSINKYIESEISQGWYQKISKFQDPKDWTGDDWCKIVVRDDPDKLDVLRKMINDAFSSGPFEIFKSEADFLEIQSKNCDKGRGISVLRNDCLKKGVTPVIYACGDYENDIPMLKVADVAVCPSNAHKTVKEICNYCLCSCDDGVIADLIYSL